MEKVNRSTRMVNGPNG